MNTVTRYLSFLIGFLLITACASTPKVTSFPDSADPSAEMDSLKRNIDLAKEDQVDVLAKDDFKHAEKQLREAMEAKKDAEDNVEILQEIAEANAWLDRAKMKADVSRTRLIDIVTVRKRALDSGAKQFTNKDLNKADEVLFEASSDFQDKDYRFDGEERRELLNKYLTIETNTIRNKNLETAKENVALAEKENAKKFAPSTLKMVKSNINELDSYIVANQGNSAKISELKNKLDKRSAYLLKITREAKINKNKTAEQLAIEDSARAAQTQELTKELVATESTLAATESTLAGTASALVATNQVNKELAPDAELNQKYQDTKNMFADSEADVFLEGNKILIRLKGLQFAVGGANLNKTSLTLLSKVENAITEIGSSNILVEGHTDSTGSKKINQKLSAERAQTVEKFLTNNGSIDTKNIETEGFGDSKPLATNKTKEGRAQNRRVDVVISPL